MQSELQFLIDLLLNHKLGPSTKKIVADRIGEVEQSLRDRPLHNMQPSMQHRAPTGQAASTQRILDSIASEAPPIPVEAIAQTPATAAALAARQATIAQALSNKPEPGRASPRKF